MDIFINKKTWNQFTPEQMENYKEEVFKHYRNVGFPYYSTSFVDRSNEYRKLMGYDYSKVLDIDNKIIKQSMHGLNLAWSYMPHSFEVQCNSMRTVYDLFNDDELFKKVIDKRIRFGDNMSDSGIRKTMKIFSGTQCVSNFRPTAAAALYSHFCEPGETVWDISSGFGGRLLGAHLAKVKYIGTDPSTKSYNGLVQMIHDFGIDAEVLNIGSEDYNPTPESLDFIFTSPPYFDTEKYSTEETQSYKRFSTKDAWLNGYLYNTFKNAYVGLKPGKYMAINIANVKSFMDLESSTIMVAEQVGFTLSCTWKLALSAINGSGFKYEPIFIFQKQNKE